MSAFPVDFRIKDSDGAEHHYTGTLHPWEFGAPISHLLMQTGIPALLAVQGGGGADMAKLADMAVGGLARLHPTQFPLDVLRFVSRDGVPLNNKDALDKAFRGNYAEAMLAIKEVVTSNRFLPLELGSMSGFAKPQT